MSVYKLPTALIQPGGFWGPSLLARDSGANQVRSGAHKLSSLHCMLPQGPGCKDLPVTHLQVNVTTLQIFQQRSPLWEGNMKKPTSLALQNLQLQKKDHIECSRCR